MDELDKTLQEIAQIRQEQALNLEELPDAIADAVTDATAP